MKEGRRGARTGPHGRSACPTTDRPTRPSRLARGGGRARARRLSLLPAGEGVRPGSGRAPRACGRGAPPLRRADEAPTAAGSRRYGGDARAGGDGGSGSSGRMSACSSSRASTPGDEHGPPSVPTSEDDDRAAVERQLGRPVRAFRRVVRRCPYGRPAVTEQAPYAADGSPFPTTYYLTCPHAVAAVSRFEAAGGVERWSTLAAADGTPAGERRASDRRAARAPPDTRRRTASAATKAPRWSSASEARRARSG